MVCEHYCPYKRSFRPASFAISFPKNSFKENRWLCFRPFTVKSEIVASKFLKGLL